MKLTGYWRYTAVIVQHSTTGALAAWHTHQGTDGVEIIAGRWAEGAAISVDLAGNGTLKQISGSCGKCETFSSTRLNTTDD